MGRAHAKNLPSGYEMTWTVMGVMRGAGWRMLKKRLKPPPMMQRRIPRTAARKVRQGMSGSSMLLTLALTSGNGESSSSSSSNCESTKEPVLTG